MAESRFDTESSVAFTARKHSLQLRFSAKFSDLFKHWDDPRDQKPAAEITPGDENRVVVMARMEMSAVPASLAIPTQASAEAYYELGLMYASGRGTPVDLVSAQKWFNIAQARGCARAAEHRRDLALEMTRDEIAEALREARAFLTRH